MPESNVVVLVQASCRLAMLEAMQEIFLDCVLSRREGFLEDEIMA